VLTLTILLPLKTSKTAKAMVFFNLAFSNKLCE
jgi:hypothetical protein